MTLEIKGVQKDLDGFSVTRILPAKEKRMVGPFVFVDHMGPAVFEAGDGIDVRPHPHIGLATITYMFEGSLLHSDSLGNNLEIKPGDVNWMTAGRGIVHSERETIEVKAQRHTLNGLQCWLALPEELAEIEPSFTHIKRAQLPHHNKEGVIKRLIAGEAHGLTSPIKTYSKMFYLDVLAKSGRTIERPNPDQECMIYIVTGEVELSGVPHKAGQAIVLESCTDIKAVTNTRFIMLGGQKWEKAPHMFWNFVSFSKDRIEQAKEDWREKRFPRVPGDEEEYTPLPGD